jgi:hypothetical protein
VWVELVFMMLILKLPAIYLGVLCWYAIRAEPRPLEGAATTATPEPATPPRGRTSRRRGLPRPPHGAPQRSYPRVARTGHAHARLLDDGGAR